jgi:hypothetical protein
VVKPATEKADKPKIETFALGDDRMFLNTLVHRIAKEKEVKLTMIDNVTRIGFITGLDEEWIQITTTEGQHLVLLNIVNISVIEETGQNLREMEISDEEKEAIQSYCLTIFVKARNIFREKQESKSRTVIKDEPRNNASNNNYYVSVKD